MSRRMLTGKGRRNVASDAAETTAFLARVVANGTTLDATHIAAYKALINGLVADNVFASKFDGLWVPATQDLATARLNLISSSFALANNSSDPAFVADRGITASNYGQAQDTQFNPSTAGGKYALNSAHFMTWLNQTGASSAGDMGTFVGAGGYLFLYSNAAASNWQASVNDTSNSDIESTATGKGFYLCSRLNSSGFDYYYNNTVSGNKVEPSTALPASNVFAAGVNGNGNGGKQVSALSVGGGLSSTDVSKFYARLQTYMAAVGN